MNKEFNVTRYLTHTFGFRWVLWIAVAAWFLTNGLENPYNSGSAHDWFYFTHHAKSAHLSYTKYHQFPAWDPYYCGGILGSGNAQSNAASPTFLFSLIFGLLPGMKIGMLFLFILGLEGTYQYAKHKGIVGVGAIVAPLIFCFCGRFLRLFMDGHLPFLGLLLIPWILLCFEKGFRSYKWTLLGGFFMAWLFLEGGAVTTPMVALLLLFALLFHTGRLLYKRMKTFGFSLNRSIFTKLKKKAIAGPSMMDDYRGEPAWYRPMIVLALMGVVTVCLSAVRLLPLFESLLDAPRVWHATKSFDFPKILGQLFLVKPAYGLRRVATSNVGVWSLVFFLYACYKRDRTAQQFLLFGFLFFTMATGDKGLFGIYDLVKKLPFYENLRHPDRYTYLVAFFVAIGAGRGLFLLEQSLLRWLDRKKKSPLLLYYPRSLVVYTVISIFAVLTIFSYLGYRVVRDPLKFNQNGMKKRFNTPPARPMDQSFKQSVGNRWNAHVWSAANMGSLSCFEEQPYHTSPALRGDLPQEEYLADPEAGKVKRTYWSPHRIELEVALIQPARIIVNQNNNRGWQTNKGKVVDENGLLAIEAPQGQYNLTITFSDPVINWGKVISLLTILFLLIWSVVAGIRYIRRYYPI